MPIDRVVTNASPLIVLCKGGYGDLIGQLWEKVVVPEAVWREVVAAGKADAAAQVLPTASWAVRTGVPEPSPLVLAWDLGAGESEVLSYARQHPGCCALVDDAQARRCAQSLGIPTLGTGAMLVLAKRRGLIPSVSEALDALSVAGLWLSAKVIRLLKEQADE